MNALCLESERSYLGSKPRLFVLSDAPILDIWGYLYDPTGVMPKADAPGPREFARIDDE